MIKQIMINYPEEYLAVINSFNKPPHETIRVNTLKISPEELKKLLEKKGFHIRSTNFEFAFHVDSSNTRLKLGATHEYLQGYYYIQSIASMIPVYLLYPEEGDKVLDMCAAPGSKTTQIGQYLNQTGLLVAVDSKISRIKSLNSNIKRCGIDNCITFPYDSTQLKPLLKPIFKPNKILLDAPCTGSGIIRIDPTLKKVRNDANIIRMARIQKKLLKVGLEMLEPGGLLMYSTCSFHYQENEEVVKDTLKKFDDIEIIEPNVDIGHPGFESIDDKKFGVDLLKTRRIYTNRDDMDAFFYCLLKKRKIKK